MLGGVVFLVVSPLLLSLGSQVHLNHFDSVSVNHDGIPHREEDNPSLMRRVEHYASNHTAVLVEEDDESDTSKSNQHPIASAKGNHSLSEEGGKESLYAQELHRIREKQIRSLSRHQKWLKVENLAQIKEHEQSADYSSVCSTHTTTTDCATTHCEYDQYSTACYSKTCSDTTVYSDQESCAGNPVCFWNADESTCRFRSCFGASNQDTCASNPLCKWDSGACKPKPCTQFLGWDDNAQNYGLLCEGNILCKAEESQDALTGETCVPGSCEGMNSTLCSDQTQQGCVYSNGMCRSCNTLDSSDCSSNANCEWSTTSKDFQTGADLSAQCRITCSAFTSQDDCENQYHKGCAWATAAGTTVFNETLADTVTSSNGLCVRICEDDFSYCNGKNREDCALDSAVADKCLVLCDKCSEHRPCSILHESRCGLADDCQWVGDPRSCKRKCSVFLSQSDCEAESHCVWDGVAGSEECQKKKGKQG